MTAATLDTFTGMLPRLPAQLLPDNAAELAENCDFAYGELRGLKDTFLLQTLATAISSLYTDDGIRFYTWTTDVDAVRSPVVDDTFSRVYYTSGYDFRVTNSTNMSTNGGAPASSYRVGVARPTAAPVLTVKDGVVLPTDLTLAATFFYEANGVKYQEQAITLTVIEAQKKYRFTPPARTGGTGGGPTGSADETIAITAYIDNDGGVQSFTQGGVRVAFAARDAFIIVDKMNEPAATNGQVVSEVSEVRGVDGQFHDVRTLYSMTAYSDVNDGATPADTSTAGTPSTAFPALLIVGKSAATNEEAFSGYTSNSSFVSATQKVKIALAQNATDTTKYDVTLDFGTAADAEDEARAYVYTYVNTYNEEGSPSPPAVITGKTLDAINAVCAVHVQDEYAPVKMIRLYRSVSGSDTDNYFLVLEFTALGLPAGNVTLTDSTPAAALGSILESTYWLPPAPSLRGIRAIGNGMLIAWKGNELWACEAFRPHAWSPNNVLTFPHVVVACEPHGAGALVCTKAGPHLVSGVSPDSLSQTPLSVPQACVAKRAITQVNGATVYASHDGLVEVSGGVASLDMSERFFTREVWRSLYGTHLSALRLAAHDGCLLGYFTDGAAPFLIRIDEAAGTLTNAFVSGGTLGAHFNLPVTDGLYVAQGNKIMQWAAGNTLMSYWRSKQFIFPKPLNFAGGYVSVGPNSNFAVNITAVIKTPTGTRTVETTRSFNSSRYFRLPAGFYADQWSVEIVGTGIFKALKFAESMRELETI